MWLDRYISFEFEVHETVYTSVSIYFLRTLLSPSKWEHSGIQGQERRLLVEELERSVSSLDGLPRAGLGVGVVSMFVGEEGVELNVFRAL